MYLIDSYQFETLYKILSSTSEVDVKTKHNSKQMTRKKNKTEQNKTKRLQWIHTNSIHDTNINFPFIGDAEKHLNFILQ